MNVDRKRTSKTPLTVWMAFCVGLVLILPGARAATERPNDPSSNSANVSHAGSFPSFLVYKVRTELQRRICQRHYDIKNPTVVVLADGEVHLSRSQDRLTLSPTFIKDLAKVISNHQDLTTADKTGGIVVRMLQRSPSTVEELKNHPSSKEAAQELERIGKILGFSESKGGIRFYAQSDADVSVYAQYVCAPLLKGSDAATILEPKVGDNRVAVYPVRSKLSRGLTGGADCLIEYFSPIDSKTDSIVTSDLKEFVSACLKRAKISETDKRLDTVIHVATSTFENSSDRTERQFQIADELRKFHQELGLDPFSTSTHTHY